MVETVDVSDLEIDMPERAQTRLMYQFQNSKTLLCLAVALANMEQESYDAVLGILRGYQLNDAVGAQLDVLGRIAGQERILLNAEQRQWFGTDANNDEIGPPDAAPAWATNAPLFGNLPADDAAYRELIAGKIFKNHVSSASVPEVLQFAQFLTGRNISIRTVGPFEISLLVPSDMPYNDVLNLLRVLDDQTADRKYLMPLPAGARIVSLTYRPNPPFAPDRATGAPDLGRAAIIVELT